MNQQREHFHELRTFVVGQRIQHAALGTQHEKLEQYLGYLDYAVYSAIAIALVVLVVRRIREASGERKTVAPAED